MASKDETGFEKITATVKVACTASEKARWRAAFPKGSLSSVVRRLLNAETAAKAHGQSVLGPG